MKRRNYRELGALWLGKLVGAAAKIGGRGGTTLPGRLAAALAPRVLPFLAGPLNRGSLVVTGTNGKTTTANLLANIFRQAGFNVIHNSSGSNLSWGVSSSLISAASWKGKPGGDLAIMEADEGAFPGIVRDLRPQGVVITNVFRDQLDRYGEVDRVRSILKQGLKQLESGQHVVLNADDPSAVYLGRTEGIRPFYYGMALDLPASRYRNTGRDYVTCPACGRKLFYSMICFAHLGRFRCPSCSFRRPDPQIRLIRRDATGAGSTDLGMAIPGGKLRFSFSIPGLYNLYNALAAAACALACGLPPEAVRAGLESSSPSFGRMEQFKINGKTAIMGLVKNPAGANEVLSTFLENPGRINLLIAVNDNYADGTDVSWLWDVDFEQLEAVRPRLAPVTVCGTRALDMSVRLKYAGLESSLINVLPDTRRALVNFLQAETGKGALLIMPTYTAMLELREAIHRMGFARQYWDE